MAISIEPREVLAERWARGCERATNEALAGAQTHARVTAALSFLTGTVRTVSRRAHQYGQVTLSRWAMEFLGVKIGDQVLLEPTEHNTLQLRRVTDDDLSEIARAAVERASRLLPVRQTEHEHKVLEKRCEQCGEPYQARRAFQRFCRPCRKARNTAQMRAYQQTLRRESEGHVALAPANSVVLP